MSAIHQFVPFLLPGDATGQHTLRVREVVRSLGVASDIYVDGAHPDLEGETLHFTEYPRRRAAGDVLLYQLAVDSVLADFLYALPETLIVNYHNVTPPGFFRTWEPGIAFQQSWGRAQMARLADRSDLAVADSAYNEAELVAEGYGSTTVVPILLDVASFDAEVDVAALARLEEQRSRGGADLLFVGRLSPNKAQHDLVKALYAYRRLYDPDARLHLVGRSASARYTAALRSLAEELGVDSALDVAESVSQGELAAYYRSCDVLLSASEHEGFCVPLLEAMHHGVPVVAFGAAAVPETLGPAGIVLDRKDAATLAVAAHLAVSERATRQALVAGGHARLAQFDLARSRQRMSAALEPFAAA